MVNVTRSIVVELVRQVLSLGYFLVLAVFAPVDHCARPGFVLGHPRYNHCLPCNVSLSNVHLYSQENYVSDNLNRIPSKWVLKQPLIGARNSDEIHVELRTISIGKEQITVLTC